MRLLERIAGRLPGRGGERGAGPGEERVDPRTPIGAAAYVVFDTELTGLNFRTDSIVSIGAVRMRGGSILVGEHFSRVVEPRTELTGPSILIHEITHSEARGLPGIGAVLPAFLEFCRGSVLVGHGVSIDLRFLNDEMLRHFGRPIGNPAVDTMALAAYLKRRESTADAFRGGDVGPLDLRSLARERGITPARAHDAVSDAFVTAQLFQRHLAALPAHGVRTLGDLVRTGKPWN